ncbi:HAMP domain-containing protein [Streptomyces piniterrae]|uniref:histidine kinase n=1 Tax=Streptomyces piniterrae TaxID=2571125 RepID=A0A4V5MI47_9ACTN|nr:nitrate- and nitrite sensing domain-containing protein [Streptomyces piniterrae]TJZ43998.1 HAMP domain-containing protein [Streptomyces piniterrae]
MRFRGKSIRRKIVALLLVPLVSLTAMWAFATYITGREANQLLDVGNVVLKLGSPVDEVVRSLQRERRQSLLYLADRRGANAVTELRQRTRATDEAVERLRGITEDPGVREDLSGDAGNRMDGIISGLDGLTSLRAQVEANTVTRDEAMEAYSALVDPQYDFLLALNALDDAEMDRQGRALVIIARAREAFAREDALISAALVSGSMSKRDLRAFSDRIAERRVRYSAALAVLPAKDRGLYDDYWRDARAREVTSYEDQAIAAGAQAAPRVLNAERWDVAAEKVLGDLRKMGEEAGARYRQRVEPVAVTVVLKAGVAGVIGFIALLVSVIVSFRIGRRHIKDLTRLRKGAHEVSGVRLPSVMRRLAAGEQVDVETEAPRLEFGQDEMGQVGQALNTLQRAAVEAAVKQADMRRGVSEVFVNLARRSQVLLHRQLTLLDTMERRTEDTEELADLFRLDHMTTRMRRHAEGLVILSGAAPSRQWRKPIQLMDVVRAAVAEVEDYERIEVRRLPRLAVDGPAVSDLTHLIAELLENATVFSPPHTAVQVLGERVANGFTLEIHDRGLGMTADLLLDANLRLAETPEFELSDTDRLGLFVVSRLAQRQGVRVSLQTSPYGGTTAVVFIPGTILTETSDGGRDDPELTAGEPAGGRGVRELEGPAGRLAALSQVPVPLPERESRTPGIFDGPVELEAPLGPDELSSLDDEERLFGGSGAERTRGRGRRGPSAPTGPVPSQAAPSAPRSIAPVPPVPDGEQHHQTRDQAPAGGLAPLPRRPRPPVLVSDHGRTVDDGDARGKAATGRPDNGRSDTGRSDAERSDTERTDEAGSEATTSRGLPRRVRQASLAPQLKPDPDRRPEPAAEPADDRDAEAVRARMASLQRGWQRGRRDNDETAGDRTTGDTATGGTAPARAEAPQDADAGRTDDVRRPDDVRDIAARGDGEGTTAPGTTSGGDGP